MIDANIDGMSSRENVAKTPKTLMQLETQEFLHFIASLVRLSKGMRIDLTVADIRLDSEEFRRGHKRVLELARVLGRRPRKGEGRETR